jgi:L-threonylcarbamoyladenylate synthase
VLNQALKALKTPGTIGVIPTDTVYGVVARAEDTEAVGRLYKLKKREDKPGTLIAASIAQLELLGLKHRYLKAVEQYWPGAISVIIPTSDPKLVYLHKDKYSLAVRIPKERWLNDLMKQTGPLLTSSANPPGEPTAETIEQSKKYFNKDVDFYIDGGKLNGPPSTLIRVLDDAVDVIRQGSVKIDNATMKS